MPEMPLILNIDDNNLIRAATIRILEQAGYRTCQAGDGLTGLQMTLDLKPALILLDVNLPDISGIEVCRLIKADPTLSDCFVVLCSGMRSDTQIEIDGLASGADGYFALPISSRELLARVQALLRIQQTETALRESEKRLREVLENSLDVSYKRNLLSNDYDYLSPVFARISGYTPQEMRNLPLETVLNLIHPQDQAEVDRVMSLSMSAAAGTPHQIEYRFKHKDGSYRWFHDQYIVVKATDGSPLALIGSVSDITERKKAESVMQLSEQNFRNLAEHTLDGILIADSDGRHVFANQNAARLLGYSVAELLEQVTLKDTAAPESYQQMKQRLADRIAGRPVVPIYETSVRRKDGTSFFVEAITTPTEWQGQPCDLVFFRDITERKQYETELMHYAQNTTTLYEFSQQVHTNLELDSIYEKTHRAVERLMTCDAFVIAILDQTGQAINDVYLWDKDRRFPGEQHYPRGRGLSDYIISSGKSLLVNDWDESYNRLTGSSVFGYSEDDTKSVLGVPLFHTDGTCFGTISTQSYLLNQYTAEHEQLLVTLANQVSKAIENTLVIKELQVELTERNRVEEELRKSEAKYRLLAENMADVIWTLDLSGKFTYVSPSVFRLRGYTSEQELNQSIHNVMTPESHQIIDGELPRRLAAFANGDESERVKTHEIDQYRKDGSIVPTEVVTTLLTNAQGQVTQILGVSRDITARKRIERAEKNQRTMAEALRDTARALNSTLDFNGVLGEILKNVGRVVPIASANIALADDQGKLRYTHFFGYHEHPILEEELTTVGFSLEKSPIYRMVYETGQPMIIPDTHADPRWIVFPGNEWISSFAVMPIRIKNKVVGFLNLDSPIIGMYTLEHIQNLLAFADQAALAIENAQLYSEVREHTIRDELTGIVNRRGLFQIGELEVQRAIRFQHPLTAIMFDVDHFKYINDTYGHLVGDRILCILAKCCQNLVRKVDIVTRYGGDEFVLILTETDLESAVRTAERLRQKVESTQVSVEADESIIGRSIHVTISLGITGVQRQGSDNIQDLINRADQAMYSAKEAGRNQIKVLSYKNRAN